MNMTVVLQIYRVYMFLVCVVVRSPKPHGCLQLTVKGVSGLIGTEWKLQSILTGSRSNDPCPWLLNSR